MEQAIELLDSILDLQLGNTDMNVWLQRLAQQTGAAAAYCASWPAQRPDSATINMSDKHLALDAKCLPYFDRIITLAAPETPGFLNDIARNADLLDEKNDTPLNDPSWMIAFLDSYPACTILALRCIDSHGEWSKGDRMLFSKALPVLLKASLLHKHITLTGNKLNIANKILDSAPRGLISMTPAGEIMRMNSMARDLVKSNDGLSEKKGQLICNDTKVMMQLKEKLAEIRGMPLDALEKFVWNRSFQNSDASQKYMLSLSAFPLEGWRLESNPHDRFVVVNLYANSFTTLPTADQLGDFYDLTNAQARLVIALMQGKKPEEAAVHLNVSVNTIRSHLRAVYSKLGTDNKADLIRIVSATLVGYSTTPS